jgi:hypothetical protein
MYYVRLLKDKTCTLEGMREIAAEMRAATKREVAQWTFDRGTEFLNKDVRSYARDELRASTFYDTRMLSTRGRTALLSARLACCLPFPELPSTTPSALITCGAMLFYTPAIYAIAAHPRSAVASPRCTWLLVPLLTYLSYGCLVALLWHACGSANAPTLSSTIDLY